MNRNSTLLLFVKKSIKLVVIMGSGESKHADTSLLQNINEFGGQLNIMAQIVHDSHNHKINH